MFKVVYNDCYGGFGLSTQAINWLEMNGSDKVKQLIREEKSKCKDKKYMDIHIKYELCSYFENKRHDKDLISVVETLGDAASDTGSLLAIQKIDGRQYRIDEYDGYESVETPDDTQWIFIED